MNSPGNFIKKIFGRAPSQVQENKTGMGNPLVPPDANASIAAARQPSIWFRRTEIATGKSWLGGLPTLPPGVTWPRHGKSKAPLHFLAQVDLAALPPTPLKPGGPILPRDGLLLFFADIEAEMNWIIDGNEHDVKPRDAIRVLHVQTSQQTTAAPVDLPDINHSHGEKADTYSAGFSVYPKKYTEAFIIDSYDESVISIEGEPEALLNKLIIASIEKATGEPVPVLNGMSDYGLSVAISRTAYPGRPPREDVHLVRHQMFGAPFNVQGAAEDMQGNGMVCLLQLDSDFGVHEKFMFCDVGMIQYWISPNDLRNRRFDKVTATTEGG